MIQEEPDPEFVPLYLCCAEENEVALVALVDELRRESFKPAVVSGVDIDASGFLAAIDEAGATGLFVVCCSRELDSAQARRLSGLFSARRGPRQRLVTVSLPRFNAVAVLPEIRAAMHRLFEHGEDVGPDTDGPARALLRDVVGLTPVSAVRSRATAKRAPDRWSTDGQYASGSSQRRVFDSHDVRDLPGGDGPGLPRAQGWAVPRVSDDEFESQVTKRVVPRARSPVAPPLGGTVRNPSDRPEVQGAKTGDRPVVGVTDRSTSRIVLFAALGGMAALAVMAVLYLMGDPGRSAGDPPDVQASVATRRDAFIAKRSAAVDASDGSSATKPVDPVVTARRTEEEDVRESVPSERNRSVQSSVPIPPSPPGRNLDPRIEKALAQGRLQATDEMLYLEPRREPSSWEDAQAFCRQRKVNGVGGFDLPTRAQLARLKPRVGSELYWSRTKGEHDDEAYALDGATGRYNVYLLVEPAAKAVCVRRIHHSSVSSAPT